MVLFAFLQHQYGVFLRSILGLSSIPCEKTLRLNILCYTPEASHFLVVFHPPFHNKLQAWIYVRHNQKCLQFRTYRHVISVIKFEAVRIHILSDVFVAVAVVRTTTATVTKTTKQQLALNVYNAFCSFLCCRCATTTWNFPNQRFMKDANTRKRLIFSFS